MASIPVHIARHRLHHLVLLPPESPSCGTLTHALHHLADLPMPQAPGTLLDPRQDLGAALVMERIGGCPQLRQGMLELQDQGDSSQPTFDALLQGTLTIRTLGAVIACRGMPRCSQGSTACCPCARSI